MKLIAHRGNIAGPSKRENAVEHIQHALSLGFDAEVDVWYSNGWWLGHDKPTYLIDNLHTLFDNSKIWWHCKNFTALEMLQNSGLNYFWHQEDDHTLTSKGYIWTYPGKDTGARNIIVMPEMVMPIEDIKNIRAFAICSDYVSQL
jgi:hypothetical protein